MKSTYFITLLSLCITSDVLSHPFMQGFGQSMANMQQNLQNAFNGPSYPGNYQLQSYDPNYQGNNGWNDNFKNSLNFPVSSSQGNSGWNNQFQNSLNFPNVRNSPGNSGWYDPFQNNNRNFPGSSCWNNQCQNNWNFE
ncbi:uncharacterized protein LOC142332486 [Lycorma delicatula]|uniref:uncharacterized protein LOC142332486 n=1 Tax=Lycorma delicatula TaxID=130591 RepID=UPI003F5149F1